jgi:CheY-like chemotaxis protein
MASIRLIEDDANQREIRQLVLEMKGYQVVGADEAADLILMDLRLPTVAAGRELLRQFAALEPRPLIVVLSGAVQDLRGTPEEAIPDALLEKPCVTGKMLQVIETLLGKSGR